MDASSLYQHRSITQQEGYHALLIGQYGSSRYPDKTIQEESLKELYQLSETAGVASMVDIFVHVADPDPGSFFSSGVIGQIKSHIVQHKLNLVIADTALKPGQLRTLEEQLDTRVIGRIELILDIFAMRARTRTSALQVELAQLMYILPRLKGLGGVLSRLGGGIGTRGPGETMLETDRRHIRKRIQKIQDSLKKVSRHRENTRKNRNIPTFALAGYTNAGKTSLLNRLSSSANTLLAEDRLFATLDPHSRKVFLGHIDYKPYYSVITDTVGFIRNLPAALVAAFQSTLEEINYTDAIIIVLDSSSSQLETEYATVQSELERLEVNDRPVFLFLNKDDLIFPEQKKKLQQKFPMAIWGNTMSKEGVIALRDHLFEYIETRFEPNHRIEKHV